MISFLLNVAVNLPIMYYLGKILMMGSIFHTTIASIVITGLYFMLKKFINLTKYKKSHFNFIHGFEFLCRLILFSIIFRISKASSYGVKKDK